MLFDRRSGGKELRMQAQLLDVAQNEEGIFYFSFLHDLLQVLVLDQILVDNLLHSVEW